MSNLYIYIERERGGGRENTHTSVVHADLPPGHCKCLEELFTFIFSTCGPPLAVCSEWQGDSCRINDTEALYYSSFVHLFILPVLEPAGRGYRGQWCVWCALHCTAVAWHGKNNLWRSPALYWRLFQSLPRWGKCQVSLQCKHTEYFQQYFLIFLHRGGLGCVS